MTSSNASPDSPAPDRFAGGRQLVYLGGTLPAEGTSTPVVLLRHLGKAADVGWLVRVVAPESARGKLPSDFDFIPLPSRRFWWPPASRNANSLLSRMHVMLSASVIRRALGGAPAALLCVLPDFPEAPRLIAERLARSAGLPLTVIMHDEPESWVVGERERAAVDRRCRRLLATASRVWFVSPELRARYSSHPPAHWEVLAPVPDDRPLPTPAAPPAPKLKIVHAGKIFPDYIPGLRLFAEACDRAGHRLEIIADDEPGLGELADATGGAVTIRPRFKRNEEVLSHLIAEAHALLVFYPETGTPWCRTSFPSRLVEYVRLGPPVLIVAPATSTVHAWAKARAWNALAAPDDPAALKRMLADLADPVWAALARADAKAAAQEFDPRKIHRRFLDGLMSTQSLLR